MEPTMIIGILPILSASFPLKGRDNMAVTVNNPMINPLYSAPPKEVRYAGIEGITMLKLPKKRSELMQSNQNWLVYIFLFNCVRIKKE
jgi:hypothetical protein